MIKPKQVKVIALQVILLGTAGAIIATLPNTPRPAAVPSASEEAARKYIEYDAVVRKLTKADWKVIDAKKSAALRLGEKFDMWAEEVRLARLRGEVCEK